MRGWNLVSIDLTKWVLGFTAFNPTYALGATLSSYFAPLSGEVKPHSMQLYFNPTQIASFNNTIPFGNYLFDLDPADYKEGANPAGVVNQVIGITSQHGNGGHYQVSNGNRLDLVLDQYTCYRSAITMKSMWFT